MKKIVIAGLLALPLTLAACSTAATTDATEGVEVQVEQENSLPIPLPEDAEGLTAEFSDEDILWAFLQEKDPFGAEIVGRENSLDLANAACEMLRAGGTKMGLAMISVEANAGLPEPQRTMANDYNAIVVGGGIGILCPEFMDK